MALQEIILGAIPNGLGGDPPRTASTKINTNLTEVYKFLGAAGSPLVIPAGLPVNKGGTGSTNPVTARANLGLEHVADLHSDTNLNHIVRVGYCGLGLAVSPPWTDLNTVLMNGVFRAGATDTNRPPGTSGNGDSYQHLNWNGTVTDGAAVQVYYSYSMKKSFIRSKAGGVWAAWEPQLRSSDIVGSVAGGAIVEYGSNASGEFTLFADGTALVNAVAASPTIPSNAYNAVIINLPITLVVNNQESVSVTANPQLSNDQFGATSAYINSPNQVGLVIRNGAFAQAFAVRALVKGRWK